MSATGGNPITDTLGLTVPPGTPTGNQPTSWLDDLGRFAAATSAGRAAGRTTQADFNLNSTQAQQGADVGTSDANLRRRSAAMADALRGRMLQGTSDASITGLPYGVNKPTITGGERPSNIVGAADLGKSVAAQGDAGLSAPALTPENFSDLAPAPNEYDSALNVLGSAAPILGILGKVGALGKGAQGALGGGTGAAGAAGSAANATLMKTLGAVGGGISAAEGIANGNVGGGALGGATAGMSIGGPWGAAIGAGVGAIGALARKLGGNETNRQREAFAKGIIGTDDTNAFDDYLRQHLDPAKAQQLIYTAHRVIGKNDTAGNAKWMQDVVNALHQGKGVNAATNFDPLTGQVR